MAVPRSPHVQAFPALAALLFETVHSARDELQLSHLITLLESTLSDAKTFRQVQMMKVEDPAEVVRRAMGGYGIPTGSVLARKIKERPQRVLEFLRGEKPMSIAMSAKLDRVLGYQDGYLWSLQGAWQLRLAQLGDGAGTDVPVSTE